MRIKTKHSLTVLAAAMLLLTSVPLLASQMDNRIEKSAKSSYVFKTYLSGDAIKIASIDGAVTLSGTVAQESHKSMAEETVMGLPGVTIVHNQLTVTAAPASATSDAWVSERVRGTLLFHRSVSYANTEVDVRDGNVTLRGKASSDAQKQLTTEYASDVSGVKTVDNLMTVVEPPASPARTKAEKVDDASVSTQVRMSLQYHHGMDGFDTKVSTNKGVVTLTGSAKNQAEKDLATKRVNDVHGVKSVNNQMTVASL
jgi:hyperosmotically inducible protein